MLRHPLPGSLSGESLRRAVCDGAGGGALGGLVRTWIPVLFRVSVPRTVALVTVQGAGEGGCYHDARYGILRRGRIEDADCVRPMSQAVGSWRGSQRHSIKSACRSGSSCK